MGIQEEIAVRYEKLNKIKQLGIDPYPAKTNFSREFEIGKILASWDEYVKQNSVVIVGRIKTIRGHGGMLFAHIDDGTGKMQIALKRDEIGAEKFKLFKDVFDLGDFIEVTGSLFKTHTEEQTMLVKDFKILTKTLNPMPEKWHGLTDVEVRYRKRYLDLIANDEVKNIFKKRSLIVKAIRKFFDDRGFIEVETPMLQAIPGGATARPFVTHHNALDIDLYLRVAPELYLKRLIVGGLPRVYEIARCFRNEGIDHLHNPEFTQIEAYESYIDYEKMMENIEVMMSEIIKETGMNINAVPFEDMYIDFTPPYPRKTFRDAIKEEVGLDIDQYSSREEIAKEANKLGIKAEKDWSYGKILDEIFKTFVRSKILQPVFITNHPIELSPLAKKIPGSSKYVERFQLVVGKGIELVNAFSELNDPIDQEERFKMQEEDRKIGDEEAQRYDEDFISALRHGMPPTSGMGMGIDRLTALLTNSHNIKEVILFPTLRPEA